MLGEVRMNEVVTNHIELQNLKDCLYLIGRFPVVEMPSFYTLADVLMLSLKKEENFKNSKPPKLQSHLAFGEQINASLGGDEGVISTMQMQDLLVRLKILYL